MKPMPLAIVFHNLDMPPDAHTRTSMQWKPIRWEENMWKSIQYLL